MQDDTAKPKMPGKHASITLTTDSERLKDSEGRRYPTPVLHVLTADVRVTEFSRRARVIPDAPKGDVSEVCDQGGRRPQLDRSGAYRRLCAERRPRARRENARARPGSHDQNKGREQEQEVLAKKEKVAVSRHEWRWRQSKKE